MGNFHPLEFVARGSETQIQVGENLNNPIYPFEGKHQNCKRDCLSLIYALILFRFCTCQHTPPGDSVGLSSHCFIIFFFT